MYGFIKGKTSWEKLLDQFPNANFLQSWAWGEFHEHLGHTVYRVTFPGGCFSAIIEPARRGRYLEIPAGPLLSNYASVSLWKLAAEQMRKISKKERCVFIRIRPQVSDTCKVSDTLHALGFRPAPMHLHAEVTRVLDLTKSDEQLLSEMRKSTRYEIRRAQKLGITVEQSTDESLIDQFVKLQNETARRERFVPFSREYLLEQFRAFKQDDAVQLFFVPTRSDPTRSDLIRSDLLEPGAMAFVIFPPRRRSASGRYRTEAIYHYAASNATSRTIPAAYAIQWAIIQEAKKRRCATYNLWGDVPDKQLDRHRFSGPSLFKRGFGGELVSHLPAQDLPLSWKYWISWTIERVRKATRRL